MATGTSLGTDHAVEVLLEEYRLHNTLAQHHEQLRERLTAIVAVLEGGLSLSILSRAADLREFASSSTPVIGGILLSLVGAFGWHACRSYYGKSRIEIDRAQKVLRDLHSRTGLQLPPEPNSPDGRGVHNVWQTFHVCVAILGWLAVFSSLTVHMIYRGTF